MSEISAEARRLQWFLRRGPEPEELLSSWLAHLAYYHRDSFSAFCHSVWPGERYHYYDIDVLAPKKLVDRLVSETNSTQKAALASTLHAYNEVLYTSPKSGGKSRFILPAGAGAHRCASTGAQWCVECLDQSPIWKKEWRLSFVTCCPLHKLRLADRCCDCGSGAIPRRRPDLLCHICHYDFRRHPRQPAGNGEIEIQKRLLRLLKIASTNSSKLKIATASLFDSVWHLQRLFTVSRISDDICKMIDKRYGLKSPPVSVKLDNWRLESIGVNLRAASMERMFLVATREPWNLQQLSSEAGVRVSDFERTGKANSVLTSHKVQALAKVMAIGN